VRTFASEVRPGKVLRVELDHVVVDRSSGGHELAAHGHEEAVEGVDLGLALNLDGAAVETTAELHLVGAVPQSIKTIGIDTKELAGIHGVVDKAVGKSSLPGEAKLVLELGGRHGDLSGFQDGGLGGNSVVVLVNVHASINLLTGELALLEDFDALLGKGLGNKLLGLGVVGVGLDEDICSVHGLRISGTHFGSIGCRIKVITDGSCSSKKT
jgi:hypothetical protein